MTKHIPFSLSIKDSFVLLMLLFAGQIAGSILVLPAKLFGFDTAIPLGIASLLGFSLTIFAAIMWFKIPFGLLLNNLKVVPSLLALVLSIAFYFAILPIAEFLTELIPTDIPYLKEMYESFTGDFDFIFENKILAFILVCIIAPIFEEVIFRGIMLRGLLNAKVTPWVAIALSAILFGVAHLNPWQFVGAGILGAAFGFIYYRTGSLLLCMFLHFLNNFIGYYVTVMTGSMEETFFEPNYLIIIGGILASLIIGYTLYKNSSYEDFIRLPEQREN